MEYLASKTSNADFDMMYTTEKRTALTKALRSQKIVVEESIKTMKELNEFLDTVMTLDDLQKRAKVQRVLGNLHYEKELINSFLDELSK